MLIRKKRWLLVAFLFVMGPIFGMILGVFGGLHLVGHVAEDGEVNEPAPIESSATADGGEDPTDAEVTLPGGERVTIDEIAPQRKLAVVVMKDVDCPVCHRQLSVLSDRLGEFQRQGGTVVGLSDARMCVNQQLMRTLGLNFPVVSDADHQFLGSLDMTLPNRSHVMPGVVFVDENGEIDEVHQGRAPGQHQEGMIAEWFRSN